MNEQEQQFTKISEPVNSGKSGAPRQVSHSVPVFTASAYEEPAIKQQVKFFIVKDIFIADSSVADLSAIKFDAFIADFFGDIQGIDRSVWSLADRVHALNTLLSQSRQRHADGQKYLRLIQCLDGKMELAIVVRQ